MKDADPLDSALSEVSCPARILILVIEKENCLISQLSFLICFNLLFTTCAAKS